MPSTVLAYSGGLDTSVILGWLQDQGYEVHCVYVDLGQPCEDREAIMKKAHDCGASSAQVIDVQEELCRDFQFPVLQWQAKYEGKYLLGTSIARPLISKVCLQVARDKGADSYAHGATGKGNDQCRFQLAAESLEPSVKMIAPWRMEEFRAAFPGRTEMIAYCESKNIPVKASVAKPYSSDENCLHISYEAGELEDLEINGVEKVDFGMTVSPQEAPDAVEHVTIEFEAGIPTKVNGKACSALEVVKTLNEIGGRNGVGRIDVVENRNSCTRAVSATRPLYSTGALSTMLGAM
ncbi:MAG: argininosuccinate synthase, partial [Planctomycetota bacterium]